MTAVGPDPKWNPRAIVRGLLLQCRAAGLSGIASAVAVTLWSHVGKSGRAFPSQHLIALECGAVLGGIVRGHALPPGAFDRGP